MYLIEILRYVIEDFLEYVYCHVEPKKKLKKKLNTCFNFLLNRDCNESDFYY